MQGLLAGALLPLTVLAVPWATGQLARAVEAGGAYPLLPAFVPVVLPSLAIGWFLAGRYREGRALFRVSAGALVGATVVGALLLWSSYPTLGTPHRAVLALSGGPALMGFWVWIGVTLGGYIALQRRQQRTGTDVPVG